MAVWGLRGLIYTVNAFPNHVVVIQLVNIAYPSEVDPGATHPTLRHDIASYLDDFGDLVICHKMNLWSGNFSHLGNLVPILYRLKTHPDIQANLMALPKLPNQVVNDLETICH